jgi:CoA:oxalate CoA-transferase
VASRKKPRRTRGRARRAKKEGTLGSDPKRSAGRRAASRTNVRATQANADGAAGALAARTARRRVAAPRRAAERTGSDPSARDPAAFDAAAGPLSGITVVDLTRILSGPYCTMMLCDLGARVIKVERPGSGDDARSIGPFIAAGSAYFASVNRGKESVALDLKRPADRVEFEQLVDGADVLVENFRPGTMEKLGYSWPAARERWPRLVYVSVSGFGDSGPLRERPAYDMVVQAMGGIMSVTGEPGGKPTRVGTSIGDIAAGMFAATATIAALHQRHRTGQGARVDVSMLDAQVALLENAIARYVTSGEVPGPIGSRHPSIAPFGAFETQRGEVVIAAGTDALFRRLCEVLGMPRLASDPRFAANGDRCANEPALRAAIEGALASADADTWLARLEAAELPCAPVQNVAEVLAHPQIRARRMALPIDAPEYAGVLVAGNPMKLSTMRERDHAKPPPQLGEANARIVGPGRP